MRHVTAAVFTVLLLAGCASQDTVVYGSGFSFANYDYIVMERDSNSAIYGLDLKLGNRLSGYNMKLLGDKEYEALGPEQKQRTLGAQLSISGGDDRILLGLSLQNLTTGRTVATIGTTEKGDLFDKDDREDAFDELTKAVTGAIERDKKLLVEKSNNLKIPGTIGETDAVDISDTDTEDDHSDEQAKVEMDSINDTNTEEN